MGLELPTELWTAVESASTIQNGPFLIYQEGSLVIRAIRDYFQPDIGEILIDTPDIHEQAIQFMNHVMPGHVARVKLYQDETPLFSRFQIEHQIETAFSREVRLPSGGAIVIDHTEALVSVDVNSGRSTKGSDIEHTAFNTNLEAAEEVARQLRLRDLGGLVVIDFIDMESQRNQRDVENRLREALHYDRARVQTGKISRFGLLELSRQRLRPSLGEANHIPCPRCHGTGHIRGIESTALHILRITQEEAMKENSKAIQVQLPVEAATFLLNEKRAEIHKIEQRTGVEVVLIPNIHIETPNYTITRIKSDDSSEDGTRSYQMVELPTEEEIHNLATTEIKSVKQVAAVRGITPAAPAPISVEKVEKELSLFTRIKNWLGNLTKIEEPKPETREQNGRRDNNRNRNRNRNRNDRSDRVNPNDRNNQADRPQRNQEPRQQKPQQPRLERVDREKLQPAPQNGQDGTSVEQNNEQREPRNRRGRNGRRDRGPRQDRTTNDLPFVENEQLIENKGTPIQETQTQAPVNEANAIVENKNVEKSKPLAEAKPTQKTEAIEVVTTNATSSEIAPEASGEKLAKMAAEKKPRPRRPATKAKPVDLAC
jgi:ribonuclease E